GYVGWAPLPPPGLIFARHPEPELFVFVGTGSFGGPVRPGAVIVKNSVIISHTTELGGIKRESRSLGGAGTQKVMVNHGPAVETVQKASGRTFTAVPIQEAVRSKSARTQTTHAVAGSKANQGETKTENHADHGSDFGSDHGPDHSDSHGNDHSGGS